MTEQSGKLNQTVNDFLNQKLDGDNFERLFTDIYDFEDDYSNENELKIYFAFVRLKLEQFTSEEYDLKYRSEYYIDEETLRNEILKKKEEMKL